MVLLRVHGDRLEESDERFWLRLSRPRRLRLGRAAAVRIAIVDDDLPPSISVGDASVSESAGAATVPVTLSASSGRTVSVKYTTRDGTADAADYPPAGGTLEIEPGATSAAIQVPVTDDSRDEDTQAFGLSLAQPDGVTIVDGDASVTIDDDDAPPTISIDDVTRFEANAVATFTVTLSAQSEKPVSLRASTVASTATPGSSCAAGVDYLTLANVAVAFSPGQLSQPLNVGICADVQDEFNETASVVLSQLSNATAGDVSGVLTILDNDP